MLLVLSWLDYLEQDKNNHILEVPGVLWTDAGGELDVAEEKADKSVDGEEILECAVTKAIKRSFIKHRDKSRHDSQLEDYGDTNT